MYMYMFDYGVFVIMFLMSLFYFCFMHKHLLVTLLSIEYMVLYIYMFIVYYVMYFVGDMYIILMFLTFAVCEGVLGLSILVCLIRCHGNDLINSLFFDLW